MRRVPDVLPTGSLDKHAEGWVPQAERSVFAAPGHCQRRGSTPLFLEEAWENDAVEERGAAPGLLCGRYCSSDMVPLYYSSCVLDPQTTSLSRIANEMLLPFRPAERAAAADPFREGRIDEDAAIYASRQRALLMLEELQMMFDMRSYDLHTVRLNPTTRFPDPQSISAMNPGRNLLGSAAAAAAAEKAATWTIRKQMRMEANSTQAWMPKSDASVSTPIVRELHVPGALENQPSLTMGDSVLLRRAAPRKGGKASMGWGGVQNEIYGVVIERQKSSVYVQLPTFIEGPPSIFQPALCFTAKPAGRGGISATSAGRSPRGDAAGFGGPPLDGGTATQWPSFYDVAPTARYLRCIRNNTVSRSIRRQAARANVRPAKEAGDGVILRMLSTADSALVRIPTTEPSKAKAGKQYRYKFEPAYFHVRFLYSAESSAIFVMRRALAAICSPSGLTLKPRFRDLLFPTRELVRASLGHRSVDIAAAWRRMTDRFEPWCDEWFHRKINAEQKHAVAQIIAGCPKFPFLLFGPAGTGKTMTIVEAVLQLVRQNETRARAAGLVRNGSGSVMKSATIPRPLILVVAPSNAAADVIAMRLAKADRESLARRRADGLHRKFFVRVNSVRRSKASVPPQVLKYCLISKRGAFTAPTAAQIDDSEGWSVIVTTCANVAKLRMTHTSISGTRSFSHILIDEAAQALECEALVPMSFVSPDTTVCLAGDPRQLGPQVRSAEASAAGLQFSMMERLLALPAYREEGVFDDAHPVVVLRRNYRAHESLLELPSRVFYNGGLIAAAPRSVTHKLVGWEALLAPHCRSATTVEELPSASPMPLLLWGVSGVLERDIDSPSYFNRAESQVIVDIIESLLESPHIECGTVDIGVIAPFRKQVAVIRSALRAVGLGAVRVGTHDDYQGQETRVLLISTTLSDAPGSASAVASTSTLLGNAKAFNVAITRAQALCIAVGNPTTLANDAHWCELVRFCIEHGAMRGCAYRSKALGVAFPATEAPKEYVAAMCLALERCGVGETWQRNASGVGSEAREECEEEGGQMDAESEEEEVADREADREGGGGDGGILDKRPYTYERPHTIAGLLASFGASSDAQEATYGGDAAFEELQEFYSNEMRWQVRL